MNFDSHIFVTWHKIELLAYVIQEKRNLAKNNGQIGML